MSDVGGGDIPPFEAELILNLDQFFAQKERIGPALLSEFQVLQTKIGPTLQKGLQAGFKDLPKIAQVQFDKTGRVTAEFTRSLNERLASVGKSSGLAAGIEQDAVRIHEVITKIIVDFSEFRRAVEEANAVEREHTDFAQGYATLIEGLAGAKREQEALNVASREANILLRAQITEQADLRKASINESADTQRAQLQQQAALNRESLALSKDQVNEAADIRKRLLTVQIEDEKRETAAVIEGLKQQTVARRAAATDAAEIQRRITNSAKSGNDLQLVAAKRERDEAAQAAKAQLSTQEHVQSTLRIQEQASQQARLARTQQFYSLVGDAARRGGNLVIDAGSSVASRLFHVEHAGNEERIADFRSTATAIDRATTDGYDRQLSTTRSFFTRQSKIERDALIGQRRSSGSSALGGTLSDNLQNRTSKGLLGVATGQSGLNLLLGGLGVGGIGAAFTYAATRSSLFESSLQKVQVASGATGKQIDQVRKASLAFGQDLNLPGIAANDAADTFRLLANSGISLKVALGGAAKASLTLSRATASSAEDSAKVVAGAVNAFKLSGSQAGAVADIVSRSIDKSGISLAEFQQAFTQVGTQIPGIFADAQPALLTLGQMSATLALFARNSLRGSQAGTNFKVMLQNLAAPKSVAASDAIRQITLNAGQSGSILYDAAGKTRTYAQALDILRKGYNKLPTDQAKAEALKDIFGTRASAGARVILRADPKDFETLVKGLNSTGFAAKEAAAQYKGFRGAILYLKGIFDDAIVANFRKAQDLGKKVVEVFAELVFKISQGKGAWAIAREGLEGIAIGLTAIIAAKGGVEVLGLLKDVSKALVFNSETGALSGVKLLSLGFVGLAGVLGIVLTNSKSAREGLSRLFSDLKGFVAAAGKVGGQAFDGLISGAQRLYKAEFPKLKAAYQSVADDLSKGFQGKTSDAGLSGVLEHIGGEAAAVSTLFSRIGGNAKTAFTGSKTVAQRFSDLFAGLGPLVDKVLGGLPSKIGHVLAQIRAGFDGASAAPGFLAGLGRILRDVATAAQGAWRWIKAAGEVTVDLVKQGYAGLTGGGGLVGVLRGIGNAARDAVELVERLGSNIGAAVTGGGSLGARLSKVFSGLAPIVNDLFGGIPEKIGGYLRSKLIDPTEAEFKRFFGGDSSIALGILGLLRDVGLKLGRTITGVLTDPNILKVVGATLLAAGAVVISAVEGLVQGVIEKLLDRLPGALLTSLELVFLGIPILLGKALVTGVVYLKNAIVGIFDPGNGPVISAWDKLVKPIAATLTAGLLAVFALKTLSGPLKSITKFFSDNFGSAARAGLKAAITGDSAGLDSIVARSAAKATAAAAATKTSSTAFPGITGDVISGVNQLRSGLDTVYLKASYAKDAIVNTAGALKFIGANAIQAARDASPAFDAFATRVGSVFDKIKSASSTAWSAVKTVAGTAYDSVVSFAKKAYDKIGGLKGIAEGATAAVAGFFSGQAITSDDLTSKIAGLGGAIGSIAGAFAVGGPILGGFATAATLLGIITGQASNANSQLQAMRQSAQDFTKELVQAQQTGDFGPVLQDEQNRVANLLGTYQDGFDKINIKVGGLRSALNSAFTSAGTGDITKALSVLDAKFSKFGRSVADDLVPEGAITAANDRLSKIKGVDIPTLIGSTAEITVDSRTKAQQIVSALQSAMVGAAGKNQISARLLFDEFSIKQVGSGFEVVRRQIDGANSDIQKFLDQTGTDLLSLYQGAKNVNGPLGDQERLMEAIAGAGDKAGRIDLDRATYIDQINAKLDTEKTKASDIQTVFENLTGASTFASIIGQVSSLSKETADLGTALAATGGKVPALNDVTDQGQAVLSKIPQVVADFQNQISAIAAKAASPQDAQKQAQSLQNSLLAAAATVTKDPAVLAQLKSLLQIPDLSIFQQGFSSADASAAQAQAKGYVDSVTAYADKHHGQIPLDLVPFIDTNTPQGAALQALVNSGAIKLPGLVTGRNAPKNNQSQTVVNAGPNHKVFASGDIVNRPTLGVFGEAGPEVIVPLSKPQRMVELLTQALAMGGHMPAFANGAIVGSNSSPITPNSKVSKDLLTYLSTIGGVPRGDVHERRADDVFYTNKNAEMQAIVSALTSHGVNLIPAGGSLVSFNSPNGAVVLDQGAESGTKAAATPKALAGLTSGSNLSAFVLQALANLGHFPATDIHERRSDGEFYTAKNSEIQAVIAALGSQLTPSGAGKFVYQSPSGPITLDGTAGSKTTRAKKGAISPVDAVAQPALPLAARLLQAASALRLMHWGFDPTLGPTNTTGLAATPTGGLTPPGVVTWSAGDSIVGYAPLEDRPLLRLDDPAWNQDSSSTADGLQKLVAHLGDLGYFLPDDPRGVQKFANGGIFTAGRRVALSLADYLVRNKWVGQPTVNRGVAAEPVVGHRGVTEWETLKGKPVGYSTGPLAPIVRDNDPAWSDLKRDPIDRLRAIGYQPTAAKSAPVKAAVAPTAGPGPFGVARNAGVLTAATPGALTAAVSEDLEKRRLIKLVAGLAGGGWTWPHVGLASTPFGKDPQQVYKLHTPGYAIAHGNKVDGYTPALDAPELKLADPRWNQSAGQNDLGALLHILSSYGYVPPGRGQSVGGVRAFADGGIVGKPPPAPLLQTFPIGREPLTNAKTPPPYPPAAITQHPKWMIEALQLLNGTTQTYADWFNTLRVAKVPVGSTWEDLQPLVGDAQFINGTRAYYLAARKYVAGHKPKGVGRSGGNYPRSDTGQIDLLSANLLKPMSDALVAFQNYAGPIGPFLKNYSLPVFDSQKTGPKGKRPVFAANGLIADRPTNTILGESGKEIVLPLTRPERAQQLLDRTGLQSKGDKDLTEAVRLLTQQVAELSTGGGSGEQTFHIHETASPRATAREVARTAKRARVRRPGR